MEEGVTPAGLRADPKLVKKLQQHLLRNDQTIIGVKNEDPADLARAAKASASSSAFGTSPENVLTGVTLDSPKENKNRWLAEASGKPWIRLDWKSPQKISQVRLTFESGWTPLSQSGSNYLLSTMVRAPQPKLVRDYNIVGILEDGSEKTLASIKGNYQKLRAHTFEPVRVKGIRVDVLATNGDKMACIKEIRAEA